MERMTRVVMTGRRMNISDMFIEPFIAARKNRIFDTDNCGLAYAISG